ncbi:carboxypeptidase-like regulatory domain-containing protein, partial [Parabacteroides sp. GYB001]
MKKLTYLLFCLILGIGLATAQTTKVTGTVISADDNEPIIGASIVVKGTMVGTVTDFDGAFSLDVPSSAKTLVISYVGMKSQEASVQPVVNIRLASDTQNLSEIVVTA